MKTQKTQPIRSKAALVRRFNDLIAEAESRVVDTPGSPEYADAVSRVETLREALALVKSFKVPSAPRTVTGDLDRAQR